MICVIFTFVAFFSSTFSGSRVGEEYISVMLILDVVWVLFQWIVVGGSAILALNTFYNISSVGLCLQVLKAFLLPRNATY